MAKGTRTLQRWTEPEFVAGALDQEASSGQTVLVLFDRGTPEDRRLEGSLAAVAAGHSDRVRAAAVPAEAVLPRLQAWEAGRRAVDTFSFDRWPAVGVFRQGRLITTFHPRRVFFAEPLQAREDGEQLEIFLQKMVYFDPARVKEQKNVEAEAGG